MTQTPSYGIWTTDLDGNRVVGFTPAQMLAVTQERDELLAALKALDAIGVLEPDLIGIGEEIERAVRLARAAIQKATNKEQG